MKGLKFNVFFFTLMFKLCWEIFSYRSLKTVLEVWSLLRECLCFWGLKSTKWMFFFCFLFVLDVGSLLTDRFFPGSLKFIDRLFLFWMIEVYRYTVLVQTFTVYFFFFNYCVLNFTFEVFYSGILKSTVTHFILKT